MEPSGLVVRRLVAFASRAAVWYVFGRLGRGKKESRVDRRTRRKWLRAAREKEKEFGGASESRGTSERADTDEEEEARRNSAGQRETPRRHTDGEEDEGRGEGERESVASQDVHLSSMDS